MTASRLRQHGRRLVALVLFAAMAPTVVDSPVTAADWAPATPPAIYDPAAGPNAVRRKDYILDVCTTETQLDCVESIAAYVSDTWVEGTPTSTLNNGRDNTPVSRNWTIPGVSPLSGGNELRVTHAINYTGNIFLETSIDSPAMRGDLDENSLPRDMKFRATVRTSWVLPTHIAGKMSGASIKVEKLSTSGASRVTMEGTPIVFMVVSDQSSLTNPQGRGDGDVRQFAMAVSDGRFYPIKKECVEKPTIMVTENGYGNPLPSFKNGALDLQVTAPHFRTDGVTEHIGIYEATVPLETAKCLWGDTIDKNSKFDVKVIGTDGSDKNAKTKVDVRDDVVTVTASGFTFSAPTVRVSYTAPTPPTTTASSTTSSTSTPVAAPVSPAKPKGLKIAKSATGGTVGFARAKGVSYKVVATKGSARQTLKCKLSKTKVSCSGTGLAKGSWTVTVTPRQAGVTGTPATAKLKIS